MAPLTVTDSPAIPSADLRQAMGRFATGVTVVTARDSAGEPAGTTASAVSSLSLDPPLVLVCLDRRSNTLAAIRTHGAFAINVLAAGHESLSNAFARSANEAAWADLAHGVAATGSPLLDEAHVALDCWVERIADGGDHEIVIGRVAELRHPSGGEEAPLLFYGGKYARLAPVIDPEAQAREAEQRERAAAEAVECELPTQAGAFRLLAHEHGSHEVTAALVHGTPSAHAAPVVHAHAACLLGDAFGSLACDCGTRLEAAQEAILDAGAGVLLYTRRYDAPPLRCGAEAGLGPDLAASAGLLARLGIRRASFVEPAGRAARALKAVGIADAGAVRRAA